MRVESGGPARACDEAIACSPVDPNPITDRDRAGDACIAEFARIIPVRNPAANPLRWRALTGPRPAVATAPAIPVARAAAAGPTGSGCSRSRDRERHDWRGRRRRSGSGRRGSRYDNRGPNPRPWSTARTVWRRWRRRDIGERERQDFWAGRGCVIPTQREQQRHQQHGVRANRDHARRDTLPRFWMLQRHNQLQRMLASAAPDAAALGVAAFSRARSFRRKARRFLFRNNSLDGFHSQ